MARRDTAHSNTVIGAALVKVLLRTLLRGALLRGAFLVGMLIIGVSIMLIRPLLLGASITGALLVGVSLYMGTASGGIVAARVLSFYFPLPPWHTSLHRQVIAVLGRGR